MVCSMSGDHSGCRGGTNDVFSLLDVSVDAGLQLRI